MTVGTQVLTVMTETEGAAGEVCAPAAAVDDETTGTVPTTGTEDEAGIAAAELLLDEYGTAGDETGTDEAGVSVVAGADATDVSLVAGIAAALDDVAGVASAVLVVVTGTAYVVVMTLLELSGQLVTLAGQL